METVIAAVSVISAAIYLHNSVFCYLEESNNEEETLLNNLINPRKRKRRTKPNRTKNFVENTIANITPIEFQSHFRISVIVFERLLQLIAPDLQGNIMGRPSINPKKQLLAVLWLLATPDSYRSVGLRFDLGKASLYVCFERIIKALNKIAPRMIKWPTGDKRNEIERGFFRMAKLRGILGAIDGTYIRIKAPFINPEAYINRKCFYGITLQAICDHNRKFTHCYTGWPSSVSDIRIFRNSDIYQEFVQNPDQYFGNNQYIIGDKAYPYTQWCIPPYIDRGNLQPYQTNFNIVHAQTRQIIERTFALLFGRFRRLRDLDMNRTDLIPATIMACCVLHNIAVNHPDDLLQTYEDEGQPYVLGEENVLQCQNGELNNIQIQDLREQLATEAYRNRENE